MRWTIWYTNRPRLTYISQMGTQCLVSAIEYIVFRLLQYRIIIFILRIIILRHQLIFQRFSFFKETIQKTFGKNFFTNDDLRLKLVGN